MITLASNDFSDAIDFIFHKRESVSGNVKVGGSELIGLAEHHLLLSAVAVLAACVVAMPLGLWLGHIGKGEFLAISISNIGRAVPSLALLAFFIAYIGIGFQNIVAGAVPARGAADPHQHLRGHETGGPRHRRRRAWAWG